MMFFKLLASLFSLSLAVPLPDADPAPAAYASDYTQYFLAPQPAPESSQYHSQDDEGQYTFGYLSADQTKQEVKTADGVIRGAYSYVDANGLTQTVNYIADALGFRVAATNLPVHDVPQDVAVAQPAIAPKVDSYAYLPYAQTYEYNDVAQQVVAAPVAAPVAVPAAAPVVVPVAAPAVTGSQYHAQDEAGQYSFGYNDPNSIRQEVKTADGVVRGAYKYVDTDGVLQTVEYIADDAGFRVAATNLPSAPAAPVKDTPEVAAAKAAHYAALEENDRSAAAQVAVAAPVVQAAPVPIDQAPVVQAAYAPVPVVHATPIVNAAPVVQAAPVSVPVVAPVAATGSQYHAQDDAGQYSYGYADGNSVKQEVKTADGVTRGSYSYVDADGIVQTVNYISDALGFRVGATNLPVHHVDAAPAVAPVAEVAQTVAEVAQTVAEVAAPVAVAHNAHHSVMTPAVNYAYLPYATNYGYSLPSSQVVAAAPAVVASAPAPVVQAAPVAVASAPVVQDAVAPAVVESGVVGTPYDAANTQYHAQDDIGQFNYGYSNPLSSKQELKTADGVTRGSYSYVDANGIVQTVNYLSDALGFRVAATNLPVHHVEDAPAVAAPDHQMTPSVNYAYLPYATNYGYNLAAPAA